jgi:hypothetical protein
MAYPVKKPKVSCPYGKKGDSWISGWHQGVDFADPIGTPVYAVADGIVVSVGKQGSRLGDFTPTIKHKFRFRTYYCTYAHVKKSYVKAGDIVKIGQHIADIGVEGNIIVGTNIFLALSADEEIADDTLNDTDIGEFNISSILSVVSIILDFLTSGVSRDP